MTMLRNPIPWLPFLLAACAAPATKTADPVTAPDADLASCLRDLESRPDDQQLLQQLIDLAEANGEIELALAALQPRTDANGVWYRGRLHFAAACRSLEPEDCAASLRQLDEAADCFADAMERQPAYRDSCEQWLAMCLGKKGNVAFRAGEIDDAARWLLDAANLRPDCLQVALGQDDSIKLGMLRVGDRTMRDFARTERFFRDAVAAAGPDLDLLNNAAVYARDTGTRLQRGGEPEAALSMFERSYATYLQAVALEPTSVRLRNDCALVAVHHLQCDWDRSRDMLLAAIADGERQLAGLERGSAKHRELDEAIGDCHENLALWHLSHGGDPAAAAASARRSMEHFPGGERGGAKRHLAESLQRSQLPR